MAKRRACLLLLLGAICCSGRACNTNYFNVNDTDLLECCTNEGVPSSCSAICHVKVQLGEGCMLCEYKYQHIKNYCHGDKQIKLSYERDDILSRMHMRQPGEESHSSAVSWKSTTVVMVAAFVFPLIEMLF